MATKGAYSNTPLAKKLGLMTPSAKPREIVLIAAPENFRSALGDLPEHLVFRQKLSPKTALALIFVRSTQDLEAAIDLLADRLPPGASVWIIRPKPQYKPGFNENHVRDAGLARGLVDYKICSIDDDWSAIKFAWRKAAT